MKNYMATHHSAIARLPIAVEFEQLFPGATDHFITHYGFDRGGNESTTVWNSEAYFAGRYSLTMQVSIKVDYKNNSITPVDEPKFYLEEITSIDGKSGASYEGIHMQFGEDEWKEIFASNGDFSTIGVTIRRDAPVPGFERFVQLVRSPLIPVSLLAAPPKPND